MLRGTTDKFHGTIMSGTERGERPTQIEAVMQPGGPESPKVITSVKVLVVEDEPVVAASIRHTLRGLGYDVPAIASSANEAIAKVAECHPDLVLMDIRLEGEIDGVEAAEPIRSEFNVPIVYLTAYADEATIQRAKLTEPYGYILKPFGARELAAAVEVALYKHRMEMMVKERERQLSTLLKCMGDAVVTIGEQRLVNYLNPAAEKLTGWRSQDARGKRLTEVLNITDQQAEFLLSRSTEQEGDEDDLTIRVTHEFTLLTRDGVERNVDISGAPMTDGKGKVSGAILVLRDITSRRQLEEQLLQARQLEKTAVMASRTAHEFNKMLRAVLSYAQMGVISMLPPDSLRAYLQDIKEEADRVPVLIQQIMSFPQGRSTEKVLANLNDLVSSANFVIQGLIGEDIELIVDLQATRPWVQVHPGQVHQILMNMASNAKDAMPTGGKLTIRTADVTLDSSFTGRNPDAIPGDYVMLTISDTGVGIPESVKPHIFERFFSTKESGLGLGLSTCYEIVKRHNGYILVRSEPGQGTTFEVYFPRADGPERPTR